MTVKQVVVVAQAEPRHGQGLERTAFFDEDGIPVEFGGGESGPVAISDVTGLQAIIDDLTGRIEALEAETP